MVATPKYIGWFLVTVGLIVLCGWIAGYDTIKHIGPGHPSMRVNTALCFVFLGMAYSLAIMKTDGIKKRVGVISLLLCSGISLITLSEYAFNFSSSIDELFIQDTLTTDRQYPGRMSVITTLCFLLCSISSAVLILNNASLRFIAQICNQAVFFVSAAVIVCFIYGVKTEIRTWFIFFMSIHTAVLFNVISIGLMLLIPEHGLTRMYYFMPIARKAALNFTIYISAIIILMGYIDIMLVKHQLLSSEFSSMATRMATLLAVVITIRIYTGRLNRMEQKQAEAATMLNEVNTDLEGIVSAISRIHIEHNIGSKALPSTGSLAQPEMHHLITKTKSLIKELESKNELLEEFAALMSHNLRAPLATLASLIDVYNIATVEEKTQILTDCKSIIKDMFSMLDVMLEAMKLNNEQHSPSQKISFQAILDKVTFTLSAEIEKSRARVTADFAQCPYVHYSPLYLESIMLNMFTNAIKYRSPGRVPEISFETRDVNGSPVLTVSDNGIGMDLNKMGKDLFGLFKTFNTSPEAKGLGLYMTKKQVKKMGGNIEVKSMENIGSQFIITLLKA